MTAPKLRFKEFNTDYTNTTFEKLKGFSIQSGKSEEKGDTGEFPFYGSTGVIGYKDIFDYEGKSILIARVGANAGSLYQIDGKYSVSDNTLRLTVSDGTSLDYLRELLIKFNLNRLVFGTGQPLVTGGMIKKVNIFIPEFTEQTKIATFLSAVDEKISQLSQKLHLLRQYKQGMMQKLFSQQIRFKADDGSEFGEWEETTLGQVVKFSNGKRVPLSESERQKRQGEYRYYGASGVIDYVDDYLFDGEYILIGEDGANIITRSSTLAFIVTGKFWVNNHAHVFQSKEGNNIFLATYLESLNFEKFNSGTAQPKLNLENLKKVPIINPCLEEQTKIADFLSAIDQKIDVVSEQLEQAKLWKKGLLQQMFV